MGSSCLCILSHLLVCILQPNSKLKKHCLCDKYAKFKNLESRKKNFSFNKQCEWVSEIDAQNATKQSELKICDIQTPFYYVHAIRRNLQQNCKLKKLRTLKKSIVKKSEHIFIFMRPKKKLNVWNLCQNPTSIKNDSFIFLVNHTNPWQIVLLIFLFTHTRRPLGHTNHCLIANDPKSACLLWVILRLYHRCIHQSPHIKYFTAFFFDDQGTEWLCVISVVSRGNHCHG